LIQEIKELCKLRLQHPPRPGEGLVISVTVPETLIKWSRREVEVRSALGGAAERITALEAHKDLMKWLVGRLQQAHDTGWIDRVALLDAKYHLLQAELWLAEARSTN
jgi:hypothetical protein